MADANLGTKATNATISLTAPKDGIKSSPPFNGTYTITCTDEYGVNYTSEEITFTNSTDEVEKVIHRTIPFLIDNVEVLEDGRFDNPGNGISYYLHFHDLHYEVPLCTIQPEADAEWPLTGNTDMADNSTKIRTYGHSLFFPVVPLEFLYADAQTPQIMITVDGMQALCLDLNCDYVHTVVNSTITAQSLNVSDGILTITGTNIPNATTDIITFGPVHCIYASNVTTNVTSNSTTNATSNGTTNATSNCTTNATSNCTTNATSNVTTVVQTSNGTTAFCILNDTETTGDWTVVLLT
jgi:hypothetical protein